MARHSVIAQEGEQSLGVVIVGAGFIADHHGAALRASSRAHLAGVVDLNASRASAWALSAGAVPWTSDLAEALAWPGVDACIVCTPNHTHEAIALAVAEAGKHLLVEKPLTISVDAARRVVDAYDKRGLTLMAAHTHRFYDYARTVKEQIDRGAVGRPVFARLALLGRWIWPDWRAWVLDPQKSGGHALHNGVHLLDLVTSWIQDTPQAVYARGRKLTSPELSIYDYLEMSIEYAGGASAVCEMSRGHRPASIDYREAMVLGSDGILHLTPEHWGSPMVVEGGGSVLYPVATDGFAVQLESWIDTIEGGESPMSPHDAVLAVALGVAAELSIERKEPVQLDEILGGVPA